MDMIYSPFPVGCTYTRSLDFLDDQQSFDKIFGLNPVILLISVRSSRVIEDSESLRSKLLDLCSLYHLHIFVILFTCNTLEQRRMIRMR